MRIFSTFVFIVVMLAAGTVLVNAQQRKVSVDALIEETQKMGPGKDEMSLVWWIPSEFWRVTLEQEGLQKAELDAFIEVLKPYTIIAVVDGKIAESGKVAYRTEAEIRSDVRVIDAGKTEYAALPPAKVDAVTKTVLNTLKPVLVNMLGPLGSNLHFVVFPGQGTGGKDITDPTKSGQFSVRLAAGRDFVWRLPLAALAPQKTCPLDGEKLNGNWNFCPFHGRELK